MPAKYALITPARNEAAYIRKTLDSVVNQTLQPVRWVIVNDGSTDETGEIVREYTERHDFIDLIDVDGDEQRNFGSKSKAVAFAYEKLSNTDFDYIGNLDADISFDPDYYLRIVSALEANPRLGVAGGIRYDYKDGEFELVDCARNSVGGPIQFFRRECFEAIGGYQALPYGGIDAVAESTARMLGWEVRSFPEYRVYHHRATGTQNRSVWEARYRAGIRDYTIGYHPIFEIARTVKYLIQKPYILGALLTMAGYLSAWVRRMERPVSDELIDFLHREQLGRLKTLAPLSIPLTK
jgi:biofilm PGA synthesis N-glycosyltransferase PgaC